jgi:two-component system chemotaxis response regulator CheB
MLASQESNVEVALWSAIVALEERADLVERMARRFGEHERTHLAVRYGEQASEARSRAESLRSLVQSLIDEGLEATE